MKKNILILSLVLGIPLSVLGQSRIYVNEYLNIGVGARALSMAGANTASSDDVYSGYWNPAGLVNVSSDFDAGLMHAEYFAGIFKYDYGALAMPLKDSNRVLALSFIRFATDNIPYTIDYVQPDGSFDDSQLKGFSAGDYALYFSYAQKVPVLKSHPEWVTTAGVNAKVLYRNVGSMANAWGFGLDAGLQMRYKSWRFGLMMKDVTTTYTAWSFHLTDKEKQIFDATGNEIPIKSYEVMLPRFNFGIAHSFLNEKSPFQLMAELGFDLTTDGKRSTIVATNSFSIDPKLGLEASYKNVIFLRAGVGNFYTALDNSDTTNKSKYTVFQPSVGVGFKIKSLSVDYAFTSLQMQDNPLMSHIISLHINIDRAKGRHHQDTKNHFQQQPAAQTAKPTAH